MTHTPTSRPVRGRPRWIARLLSAVTIALGLVLVLAAIAFGRCDAFGGTCPADPPPPLDDDVFGLSALGAAIATGVPLFAFRPTPWGLGRAIAPSLGAALVVGLLARSIAHG